MSAETADIQAILAARQTTHGDFTASAACIQALKAAFEIHSTADLTAVQREAAAMILRKLGRIATGNPNHRDHWLDICGYARLAADRCEGS
jgi:ADP-heptose:LPS heptosyltransferase